MEVEKSNYSDATEGPREYYDYGAETEPDYYYEDASSDAYDDLVD
jgi:hypothetical protein